MNGGDDKSISLCLIRVQMKWLRDFNQIILLYILRIPSVRSIIVYSTHFTMLHPAQRVCASEGHLYYAMGSTIQRYGVASQEMEECWSAPEMTKEEKAKNIEHRAVTEMTLYKTYLIWFGEDKILHVLDLDTMEMLRDRELVKRACALCVEDDLIVVGDKFGDVYTYELLGTEPAVALPTTVTPGDDKMDEPSKLPILGHVSMLTGVVLTPPTTTTADSTLQQQQRFIVTADRDEHVRISSFPDGHNIQHYCLGHTQFISDLLIVSDRLISGGGDEYLNFWDWRTGALVEQRTMTDAVALANSQTAGIAILKILAVTHLNIIVVLMEGLSKLFLYSLLTAEETGSVDLHAPAIDMAITDDKIWISYDTERSSSSNSSDSANSAAINFDLFQISSISSLARVPLDKLNAGCRRNVEKVGYTVHRTDLMRKRTKTELETARLISGKGKRQNNPVKDVEDADLQKEIEADIVASNHLTKKVKAN